MTTTQFITFSSHLHVKRIRQHIKMSEKRAHFREMVCNVQIKLLICRMSVSVSCLCYIVEYGIQFSFCVLTALHIMLKQ